MAAQRQRLFSGRFVSAGDAVAPARCVSDLRVKHRHGLSRLEGRAPRTGYASSPLVPDSFVDRRNAEAIIYRHENTGRSLVWTSGRQRRALWKQNALYPLCKPDLDPSLSFENDAPKGTSREPQGDLRCDRPPIP
jgi:hypothetical protein